MRAATGAKVFVSALLAFHFGGMLAAIVSAAPGNWVASQAWHYLYGPYLQFMFLNCSHHWREPSRTSLLWFCVYYEPNDDGSPNWRWVKIPDFDAKRGPVRPDRTPLSGTEYVRYLALPFSVDQQPIYNLELQNIAERRVRAGIACGIPLREDMPLESQYCAPQPTSLRWLASYIRHVARTCRHERRPSLRVTHVKAYRVVHETATARQVANGWDPFDPTLYQPFFFGDFLSDGTPDPGANVGFDQSDPFLFWLVPIIRQKSESSESQTPAPFGPKPSVRNYVLVHAGVPDDGRLP